MTAVLIWTMLAALAGALIWVRRERRAGKQRRRMRALFSLSERIFLASTAGEMLKLLQEALPRILGAAGVHIYLHNGIRDTLDPLVSGYEDNPGDPIPGNAIIGSPGGSVAACFRNRTMLSSEATGRPPSRAKSSAMLWAPMLARGQAAGVLAFEQAAGHQSWNADERAALQHLANQTATALKLLEQQSMREKLFRSEKMAAAGKLIAGVAGELRAPLADIELHAQLLVRRGREDATPIVEESRKASRLVERLVAFSNPSSGQPEVVELNAMVGELAGFRKQEWRVRGVTCRVIPCPGRLPVAGCSNHLQQAFLDLLMQVEQSMEAAAGGNVEISTSSLSSRAVVRIRHSGSAPTADSSVVQGIIMSHGGEMRVTEDAAARGFEIYLPLAELSSGEVSADAGGSSRKLTALVIDPDGLSRKELLRLLGERNHRGVPAGNTEEALDLSERMRFDVAFCSVRQPGANWIEFRDRSRRRVDTFVLVTEGVDHELRRVISASGHLLRKPVSQSDLDALLKHITGQGFKAHASANR